ncbi:hypothetical protein [Nonomuraea dietziae]|uniref:hypothetical protein n=1 Tax=Nonomuraea dietziae TaxID=65515 RepID=UPI0031D3B9A9
MRRAMTIMALEPYSLPMTVRLTGSDGVALIASTSCGKLARSLVPARAGGRRALHKAGAQPRALRARQGRSPWSTMLRHVGKNDVGLPVLRHFGFA